MFPIKDDELMNDASRTALKSTKAMIASSACAVTFSCLEFNNMSSWGSDTSCGVLIYEVYEDSCINFGLQLVQARAWKKSALFHG